MSTTQTAPPLHRTWRALKQPYRILIASSGASSSLGAIRVGVALARRKSASVHVLTVAPPFPHLVPSAFEVAPAAVIDEDNRRVALEAVRRQLATVRGTSGWTVRATAGWPADCVVQAAERWPASLLIVGLGEHGVVDRLFGSETAITMARRSKVPVLAVPESTQTLPTRAVAAIDFTESSEKAATVAATLLGPNGVLTLFHASMLIKHASVAGTLTDLYTAGAIERLHAIRDAVHRKTKRRVECAVAPGEVVEELLSYVEREQCDLLALGGHDRGLVDRFLMSSVRTQVVRQARCPVLIAPHEAKEHAE